MNELQVIATAVERTTRRRHRQRAFGGLWTGLFIGSLVWLATLALDKLFPLPTLALLWAGATLPLVALASAVVSAWHTPPLEETARWLDQRLQLKERLSTALEWADASAAEGWRQLLIADAARHARNVDERHLLPFTLPRLSRWTLLILALGAGLCFVPEHRSKARLHKQADAAVINDTGRMLTDLTRRGLEARKPTLAPAEQALERVQDLGERLSQAKLTRSEALRDIASVTEKLKDQARELAKNPALQRLEEAARNPAAAATPADLQQKIDALQKSLGDKAGDSAALDKLKHDLQKLQQTAAGLQTNAPGAGDALKQDLAKSLADLAQKAADLGLSLPPLDEAMKALEASQVDQLLKDLDVAHLDLEKLAQMARALQELKMQIAQVGKNLAEQLDKGQGTPALATLQRMMEQLKQGQLSPEQLQKLLKEVAEAVKPASEYGKVGECLKAAADQMQQGDKPGAAQSLAQAAKELQRLMEQAGDAQSLLAALANLERASACIGTGQRWGQCPAGGYTLNPREGDSRPGTAAAALDITPQDAVLNEALKPTKVKGQFSPGSPMPSITLKGVSIKGASTVQYEEAATAAQADAQSALSQDKVPRAYQGAVKDYFNDLKK